MPSKLRGYLEDVGILQRMLLAAVGLSWLAWFAAVCLYIPYIIMLSPQVFLSHFSLLSVEAPHDLILRCE